MADQPGLLDPAAWNTLLAGAAARPPHAPIPAAARTRLTGQPLALHRPVLDALLAGTPMPMAQRDASRAREYAIVDGVAVVPVSGVVMKRGSGVEWIDELFGLASVEALAATFRTALTDPAVRAILLQIESPGGEVFGVFDLADEIHAARGVKPIVAVADEFATSAAYLLASAADRVVVPRLGVVGSVGVIAARLDATALDAQLGLRWTIVTDGERKGDGNPHVAPSDAELARLREDVAVIGGLFRETVARNRARSVEAVTALEADTFRGDEALVAGLADAVGTFDETLRALRAETQPQPQARRKGSTMDKPEGAAATAGADNVVSLEDARKAREEGAAAGIAAERGRVTAITQLCALAGLPERAAALIESGASEAEARTALLGAKAEAGATHDVRSLVGAEAGASRGQETVPAGWNPQAFFAKRRAAVEAAQAKRLAQWAR